MFHDLLDKLIVFIFNVLAKDIAITPVGYVRTDKPTIFVVRCSESWLDAMVLKIVTEKNLAFITDAKRMNYLPKRLFFWLMRALPVYHLDKSDSRSFIQKNIHSFDRCRDMLMNNGSVVVFRPDKNAKAQKYVRKVTARIAYNAEEVFDFKLDVQVVPVIFEYDHHQRAQKITVAFQPPIAVRNFEETHKHNPNRAIRKLTQQINVSLGLLKAKNNSAKPQVSAPSCTFV